MNSLTIDDLLRAAQLFEQQQQATSLQFSLAARAVDLEDRLPKMAFNACNPLPVNGYCTPYSSGHSQTSSLRSSPTSSMLSSGPTSPLQLPQPATGASLKKMKTYSQSTKQSRAAHNELEKNRRANLRSYLDQIKAILPAEFDSARDTTLSLLTRTRNHLRDLHQKRDQLLRARNEASLVNAQLKQRIEKAEAVRTTKRCRVPEEPQTQPLALVFSQPPVPVPERKEPEPTPEPEVQPEPQLELVKPEPVALVPEPADSSRHSSPLFLEYSPLTKPCKISFSSPLDPAVIIDPYLEGLLPVVPMATLYPYMDKLRAGMTRPALT